MDIILLLLACAGITFTIVHAEIMDILKIRPFLDKWEFTRKLTHCSLCSGTWVGIVVGLIYLNWLWIIPFAFASAAVSFAFERITILVDECIIKFENEKKEENE